MKPIAVFIGRFQPFHYGHKAIIDKVVELGYDPLILIGSPNKKTDKNPISFSSRYDQINKICKIKWKCIPLPLYDCEKNSSWVKQIDDLLNEYFLDSTFHLVTHNKPSEAGKYGLPEGQFISDFILTNSTKITGSIDLSSMDTPSINATDIRNSMTELLKLAPKSSLQTLLAAL
jgi:cytidyltransferase-like protein